MPCQVLDEGAPVTEGFFEERRDGDDVAGALHGFVDGGEKSFATRDAKGGMLELARQFLKALSRGCGSLGHFFDEMHNFFTLRGR